MRPIDADELEELWTGISPGATVHPYAKKRWKFCIECGAKMDAMTTETREDVEPYGISSNSDTKLN